MPVLPNGEIEIYYEDHGGGGRPVVLIHGWPLSGESWSAQVAALGDAGYRVVTYDRRGFGRSAGLGEDATYDYDSLAGDLDLLMRELDLRDATLVGFSMGGGEVARYVGSYGVDRVHSVVFASAIPPFLLKSDEHPEGGLDQATAEGMQQALRADREGFFDGFMRNFFSANGEFLITEEQLQQVLDLTRQADLHAAASCIVSWLTDFRDDLAQVSVPALVIHGDADGIVPIEVSGARTHESIAGSELHVVRNGPHGINTSHPDEFNGAVLEFLAR
jgi:pimeloyl-ACP methyl ester carboxylesterase